MKKDDDALRMLRRLLVASPDEPASGPSPIVAGVMVVGDVEIRVQVVPRRP